MSVRSSAPLSDISPNIIPKENQRPTKDLYPSAGSYFIEGTGSEKLALKNVTSGHSGPTHDDSSGGGGPDHESLDELLAVLEAEEKMTIPTKKEGVESGTSQNIPAVILETDPVLGLTDGQIFIRRKEYGLNQMKEEQRNALKQFFTFFIGPIQFVMEVLVYHRESRKELTLPSSGGVHIGSLLARLDRPGRNSGIASAQRYHWVHPRLYGGKHSQGSCYVVLSFSWLNHFTRTE